MVQSRGIKSGIICPYCNADDSRSFDKFETYATICVCPRCARIWEVSKLTGVVTCPPADLQHPCSA